MAIEISIFIKIQISFGQTTFIIADQLLVIYLFLIKDLLLNAVKGKQLFLYLHIRQSILYKLRAYMRPSRLKDF